MSSLFFWFSNPIRFIDMMFFKRTLRFVYREVHYSQESQDRLRVLTRGTGVLIDAIPLTTPRGSEERQQEIATIISSFRY
jgi:hypothetical protein